MSWARRLPAGVVAVGAAAATAHGLYEVVVASHVPGAVALTYPLVTDGLALVAYSATRRLTGAGARYAWTVVVTSAAVSGLAQAAFLAVGAPEAPAALRFAVGAWPALACAMVAHLLHLIAAAEKADGGQPAGQQHQNADVASVDTHDDVAETATTAEPLPVEVRPADLAPTETSSAPGPTAGDGPDVAADHTAPDQRVVELARRLARGDDLTGPAIALEHGLSDRTGRRLLADARAHLEQHQPLHLVARETSA